MKQNQRGHDTPKQQPKHNENKEPKNTSGGQAQTNIDLLKVLHFVQELSNHSEQWKTHLGINLTHQEML